MQSTKIIAIQLVVNIEVVPKSLHQTDDGNNKVKTSIFFNDKQYLNAFIPSKLQRI